MSGTLAGNKHLWEILYMLDHTVEYTVSSHRQGWFTHASFDLTFAALQFFLVQGCYFKSHV